MKNRITTKTTGLRSRSGFEDTIDRIAELTVKLRGLEAKRDKRIQAVRDESGPDILSVADQRDALMTLAENFALENRSELFAKEAKSGATTMAAYGLRLGNPTLKTLNRRWTWEKVKEAVKAASWAQFIRTEETLDKDGIKAQLGDKPEALASVGCRIDQSEAFWVEPKDRAMEG
jgi:phage host-nuclease inhibitor protein Gam